MLMLSNVLVLVQSFQSSLIVRGASNSLLMMMMIVLKYAVKRYASEVVMRNKNPMKNAFYPIKQMQEGQESELKILRFLPP